MSTVNQVRKIWTGETTKTVQLSAISDTVVSNFESIYPNFVTATYTVETGEIRHTTSTSEQGVVMYEQIGEIGQRYITDIITAIKTE